MFKKQAFKKVIEKIPGLAPTKPYSFACLNCAQFLGVLNDNVFKLVMVFLLIGVLGSERANSILSLAGSIYVIPFLLFSSVAGILADRFSKQRLIIGIKLAEVFIMACVILAFALKTPWLCYSLLFLLGTHSALFTPSKYGIIPELVARERVSRANGILSSFTYLAMILGTFFAAFLTDLFDNRFTLIAWILFGISLIGFACAFGIDKTEPSGSSKKISFFFFREVYMTLRSCYSKKHLFTSVISCSFFLFVGAYTQLNIIPMAMHSLNLTPVAGGYLFLSTAIGIAIGSFIAGKLSKKRIELGIPCVAALGIALFFLLLSLFSKLLIPVILVLVCLGVCGGLFIVPLETYNQLASAPEERGQVIATANFLSFTGVLIASLGLYLFNQILEFSPAGSFAIMGLLTLLIFGFMVLRLSDFAFPMLAKIFIGWRYTVERQGALPEGQVPILILQNFDWLRAGVLLSQFTQATLVFVCGKAERHPIKNHLFYSVSWMPNDSHLLDNVSRHLDKEQTYIVGIERGMDIKEWKNKQGGWKFFRKSHYNIQIADVAINSKKKQATIRYSDELES